MAAEAPFPCPGPPFARGNERRKIIASIPKYLKMQGSSQNWNPAQAGKLPFGTLKSPFGSFRMSNLT
jgi:hypothetical protein